MLKLKVLRYMGVLTIMKFGIFVLSAALLILALGWILVYCPANNQHKVSSASSYSREQAGIEDFFRGVEAKLDEELGDLEKREPNKLIESSKPGFDAKFTIPADRYVDEEFSNMIAQLKKSQLDGYEFLIESMNVTIYRKPKSNGLFEYKLYANMPDASPGTLTAVFLDSEYRVEWDSYVTDLYFIKKSTKGPDVVYFNVDFPWPLANRDYIYAREMRRITDNGKEYYVIIMHSVLNHNIPPKKGVVRVDDFHQMLAVEPVSTGGSRAFIHYYDDPKGSIPSWLINWAAKSVSREGSSEDKLQQSKKVHNSTQNSMNIMPCMAESLVYRADIASGGKVFTYYGACATDFKARHINHTASFRNKRYGNSTELSKLIWEYNKHNKKCSISWSTAHRANSYAGHYKSCKLCTTEKLPSW